MAHTWNDNEYWAAKVAPVNEWLEANATNEEYEDEVELISMQVRRGTRRPEMRENCWNAMLLEFRPIENAPIGGRGKTSNLTPAQKEAFATIEAGLLKEYEAGFGEFTSLTELRRSKGENASISYHESAEAYAKAKTAGRIAMLKRMLKNDEWDGTLEGLRNLASGDSDA